MALKQEQLQQKTQEIIKS